MTDKPLLPIDWDKIRLDDKNHQKEGRWLELPYEQFKTDTPVLPDVKIIDCWGHYDGPLFGICEIHGKEFFFMDVIYDIWRFYDKMTSYTKQDGSEKYLQKYQRLWSIFAVYDIPPDKIDKIKWGDRSIWQEEIDSENHVIGIFWNYEAAGKYKEWRDK